MLRDLSNRICGVAIGASVVYERREALGVLADVLPSGDDQECLGEVWW